MSWNQWTSKQEMVLREYRNLGAEVCRDIIYGRYGVWRSISATQRHAYRIGVSTVKWDVCVGCGRPVQMLNRETGYCPTCTERYRAQEARELNIRLLKEAKKGGVDDEYESAKRTHSTIRKENSRICKKYGLEGKRARKKNLSQSCQKP